LDGLSDERVAEVLQAADRAPLQVEIRRRITEGVPAAAEHAYYRVLRFAGDAALADWLRERWTAVGETQLDALVRAAHACLPPQERVERTLAVVNRRPALERHRDQRAMSCLARNCHPTSLGRLRALSAVAPQARPWPARAVPPLPVARRVCLGVDRSQRLRSRDGRPHGNATRSRESISDAADSDAWGELAAVSGLTWDRVLQWLQRGRPLSRIAIDALYVCGGFQPEHFSGLITDLPRPLYQPGDPQRMTEILRAYARHDSSPRVAQRVRAITSDWASVIAGARVSSRAAGTRA